MSSFPFPHDLHVYIIADDDVEVAYYSRDKGKYKRVRKLGEQTWQDTWEIRIDDATFWMVLACVEGIRSERHGLVGMG